MFFMSIVNKHIPSKVKNIKPKNPFVTPVIEAAIKEKRAALRALKKEPTTAHPGKPSSNLGTVSLICCAKANAHMLLPSTARKSYTPALQHQKVFGSTCEFFKAKSSKQRYLT